MTTNCAYVVVDTRPSTPLALVDRRVTTHISIAVSRDEGDAPLSATTTSGFFPTLVSQ